MKILFTLLKVPLEDSFFAITFSHVVFDLLQKSDDNMGIANKINYKSRTRVSFLLFLYLSTGSELNRQLSKWLDDSDLTFGPARAIIAP